jgi:hypothetical protein
MKNKQKYVSLNVVFVNFNTFYIRPVEHTYFVGYKWSKNLLLRFASVTINFHFSNGKYFFIFLQYFVQQKAAKTVQILINKSNQWSLYYTYQSTYNLFMFFLFIIFYRQFFFHLFYRTRIISSFFVFTLSNPRFKSSDHPTIFLNYWLIISHRFMYFFL